MGAPAPIFNRGGLTEIAYRIGDYARFRANLHAALFAPAPARPAGLDPVRPRLCTRQPRDFTLALADAFACAADVLTFYQERIANESYVRTAVERRSLQELGKLVGYRLRPGVAAEAWLAFALEVPPEPPAGIEAEPGRFVSGVPSRVTLEPGISVQSVPGSGEEPQTFETVERLDEARPEWNGLRPPLRAPGRPRAGDTVTHLAGVDNDLKVGDALLFVGSDFDEDAKSEAWDFRVLEAVSIDVESDSTAVRWNRPLGDALSPAPDFERRVYALRRRAGVLATPVALGATGAVSTPPAVPGTITLDAVHSDVAVGSYVVLAKGPFRRAAQASASEARVELFKVTGVDEVSVPVTKEPQPLYRPVTRLALEGEALASFVRVSESDPPVTLFGVSEALDLAEYPLTERIEGGRIPVAGDVEGLRPGRRLMVRGTKEGGEPVVALVHLVQVTSERAGGGGEVSEESATREPGPWLEIRPSLPGSLERTSVVVHANVVLASHGESVAELLGEGDASVAFQRFALRQLPLTYRAAPNERGVASELRVRVSEVTWRERASLHGAAATDRVYALDQDEQGRWFVVFGDGVNGARLPTGVNNVRAYYRKGLGLAGNVAAESLTQLGSRPLGVSSVSNPVAATGGTDPESAELARQTLPVVTRTLGRVVSVLDYQDFARAFAGVAKAQAVVLHGASVPTIAITIAGPGGEVLTPDSPVWRNLFAALKQAGDPQVAVTLLSHADARFELELGLRCDPAHEAPAVFRAVRAALSARFAFERRELGEPVQRSEVIAVVQDTPGVVAVDVRRFERLPAQKGGTGDAPLRLLAERMVVDADGKVRPAEVLTLDPSLLTLEEMT